MKLKKLMAVLVSCAVILSLTMPAFAASSFRDMEDSPVAVEADMLRLMGVIGGVGDNYFNPNSKLNRAEFCTMAVRLLGRVDEAANHTNRTIFRDVTARHWGRSYINLAASITIGDGSTRLIAGVGDGRFLPDEPITYAQAVTILMRVLGYTDQDAGAIWPDGYLKLADSIHLTDGLALNANDAMLRSQAVQLFANLLTASTAKGQAYYTTLGSAVENVLLLDVDVVDENSTTGAIRTSHGLYYLAADVPAPAALEGFRGTLVLNDRKEILTFIPDSSSAVAITLGSDAQSSYLKDKNGTRYNIAAETPVYTGNSETTYSKAWLELRSGNQITLYLDEGKVIGLYYATSGVAPTEALVVTAPLNSASFYYLTGGMEDYTILKDGEALHLDEIQMYDVVTYDAAANTLLVSDLHLPIVYEHASPSPEAPDTITVLGHEFPVLDSALESISQFKIGDCVVLLLTADGSVAGMTTPTQTLQRTLVGIAGSSGVTVSLPSGGTITLAGKVPEAQQGKLVTVSAQANGSIGVSPLTTLPAPGDLSLESMTLGEYKVAASTAVYEQSAGGPLVPIDLSGLSMRTIPGSKIANYHLNTSGMVDILVVENLTGDAFTYGVLSAGTHEYGGMLMVSNTTVSVTNSRGTSGPFVTFMLFKEGTFGGAAASGRMVGGVPAVADILSLEVIEGIRRSDFFQQNDTWYVNANGTVYQVADQVEGYIQSINSWFEQEENRLDAIRAYSDDMTLYIDPIGYKVRIIVAN